MIEEMKNETQCEVPCELPCELSTVDAKTQAPCEIQRSAVKAKRDIFRFTGEKPSAINLEHVTQINVDGKRISFQFLATTMFIDMDDEAAALSAFEVLLNVWAGEAK
jgi:hypothetical protein